VGLCLKKTKLFNVPIPHFGTFEEFALLCGSKEGAQIKRGVVFINETIPYLLWLGWRIKLYKDIIQSGSYKKPESR
jgi:hypothetical protein